MWLITRLPGFDVQPLLLWRAPLQNLLTDAGVTLASGRTASVRDPKGIWQSGNVIVLPVESKAARDTMVQVEVHDSKRSSDVLLGNSMIWLRDMLDHVHLAGESGGSASDVFPHEQVWEVCVPDTEVPYGKVVASTLVSEMEVVVPRQRPGVGIDLALPRSAIAGILRVSIIAGACGAHD